MENLTVLITGASEGIGRATGLRFAREGHAVIGLARSASRLASLQEDIAQLGRGSFQPLQTDLRDLDAGIGLLRETAERQRIDIAVINAGVGQYGPFARSEWSDIRDVLQLNVDAALATAHAIIPSMTARGSGSVVFVSSTLGKRAVQYNAAYCASKFALQGFAEALRLELRPHGVHVGVVCPARTETDFFNRMTYSVPQTSRRAVPTRPPSRVADAILRCSMRRRREIVVSPEGKLFAFVGLHFPRLTDMLLSYTVPRPEDT